MVVPYGSPSPRALFDVLSSPPAVLSLYGCCALFSFWFPLLQGGCASGLRCLGHTLAAKFVVTPSPSVVSHLGFFLWRLFRLGLEGCGPVSDPPFWEGLSFPCPRCFCLAVPTVCCPGSLSFLNSLLGFLSSCFQCLLIARGG